MFSNRILLSLLPLGFLWTLSCSNDHKFIDTDTVVSLAYDTNCLDAIEPDFDLYREELLSDARLKEDFKCLRDALDYVKLRVEGEEAERFSALEMKRFLNKILFKDDPKADSFYKNLLDVKSQFFGGQSTHISFQDFENLKSFLSSLERTALSLKPFAAELLFDESFKDKASVDVAVRSLVPFLGEWVAFTTNNLNLDTILDLLVDSGAEIKSKENWVAVFNLVREVRSSENLILNSDKTKLVNAFQTYYAAALNINRALDRDWEFDRSAFFDLSKEIDSLFISLERTIQSHPEVKWSRDDLVLFMNLVSDYEVLDQELRMSVREHVVDVLFGKWFATHEKVVSLESENLKKLALAWTEIDTFLVDAAEVEGYVGSSFPFVKEGTSTFALFTQQRWPSLVRADRTLLIPDFDPVVTFSFQSLFHVAWQFTAARILVESYAKDEDRRLSGVGISLEEVQEAYLDIFELLKEIEFLGEESRGGWFRIFNEGNIFVPSAQPDGFVNLAETADYAAYMYSALNMGDNVRAAVQEACPNFVETCSFTYARKNAGLVFEALPGLVGYFENGLKRKSFELWQESFEYIAKLDNNDENYEDSHWFRGTVANQYNEVIFRKYDTDGSDSLSFEEVSAAFVYFKEALKLLPQVKGTPNEDKDDVLKSFLTLFVKDGKLPELANGRPRGKLIRHVLVCGKVSTSTNKECVFESDRSKIMALLAFLTSI